MNRFLIIFFILSTLISCTKDKIVAPPPMNIPNVIDGAVTELEVKPIDINTPDKGTFNIASGIGIYKVEFDATSEAQSNATLRFVSDTIISDQSTEFANFGKDAIAYNPVVPNEIIIHFKDGKAINAVFDAYTSFGGEFGEQLISQWRTPGNPTKPTQQAKDDIINFIHRYADKDGSGPETTPVFLFVQVSNL